MIVSGKRKKTSFVMKMTGIISWLSKPACIVWHKCDHQASVSCRKYDSCWQHVWFADKVLDIQNGYFLKQFRLMLTDFFTFTNAVQLQLCNQHFSLTSAQIMRWNEKLKGENPSVKPLKCIKAAFTLSLRAAVCREPWHFMVLICCVLKVYLFWTNLKRLWTCGRGSLFNKSCLQIQNSDQELGLPFQNNQSLQFENVHKLKKNLVEK